MASITLDAALDTVMMLPSDERDMLIEIMRQRQGQEHHLIWEQEATQALELYTQGKINSQTVEEVMGDLEISLGIDD